MRKNIMKMRNAYKRVGVSENNEAFGRTRHKWRTIHYYMEGRMWIGFN
jgi:hypothetical protein